MRETEEDKVKLTRDELIVKLHDALVGKGVEFGDKYTAADILTAALDAIEAQPVVSSVRSMRRKVYGTSRAEVIATAVAAYRDPTEKLLCSCPAYVNEALRRAGFARLSEEECLKSPFE